MHATVYRVELRGQTFYSRMYARVKKRNSYTICYLDRNRMLNFAFIEYFVYVCNSVVAILLPLLPLQHGSLDVLFGLNTGYLPANQSSFIFPVKLANHLVYGCFAEDIQSKCLFLDFESSKYIVMFHSNIFYD